MAKSLVSDVLTDIRSQLHDTGGSSSNQWSDTVLIPHFQRAYRKMFDAIANVSGVRIRREWYFVLPAYTSILDPFAYDIQDMAEPEYMEDRNVQNKIAGAIVFSNLGTTPFPINLAFPSPHGLPNNQDIVVQEVPNTALGAIGRWYANVVDASNITLAGSTSTCTGTGATVTYSTDKYSPVNFLDSLSDRDITDRLIDCTWEEEKFKFRGATTDRQLHIQYIASGVAPSVTSTQIGIDNCLNFLSTAAAGFAAESSGWYQMADRKLRAAFGPKMEADGSGGMLRDFLSFQVLKQQRTQKAMGPFRKPRLWNSQPWY